MTNPFFRGIDMGKVQNLCLFMSIDACKCYSMSIREVILLGESVSFLLRGLKEKMSPFLTIRYLSGFKTGIEKYRLVSIGADWYRRLACFE